jgi:hypothetical protein
MRARRTRTSLNGASSSFITPIVETGQMNSAVCSWGCRRLACSSSMRRITVRYSGPKS